MSGLHKGPLLGRGTYGEVRLAIDGNNDNMVYAVKRVSKELILDSNKLQEAEQIRIERSLLAALNHTFIVKLVAAYERFVDLPASPFVHLPRCTLSFYLCVDLCRDPGLARAVPRISISSLSSCNAVSC